MSQKDYIFTHGLSKSLFGYWLRKYRQSCMTEGGFVEVSAQPDVDIRRKDAIFARLESADGHQLLLYESVSATYLRDLMGW